MTAPPTAPLAATCDSPSARLRHRRHAPDLCLYAASPVQRRLCDDAVPYALRDPDGFHHGLQYALRIAHADDDEVDDSDSGRD